MNQHKHLLVAINHKGEVMTTRQTKHRSILSSAAIGLALLCACSGASAVEVPGDLKSLQHYLQKHEDVLEIQNMMSLRAYYHAVGAQDKEFELYAKRPDITWGQNQGYRIGPEHIRAQYVENFAKQRARNLEAMSKLHPEIKNAPENLGVGTFIVHTLETPIIEVAEDGNTAKGMWHTVAALGSAKADGTYTGSWELEKYGVDFIKENGKWRFWHITVVSDFSVAMGKELAAAEREAAAVGAEGVRASQPVSTALPRDVNATIYKQWGPTVVPQLFPRPPEPYRTFSETFSYGPSQVEIDRVLKQQAK